MSHHGMSVLVPEKQPQPEGVGLPTIRPGRAFPLGAQWDGAGVNFALFSEHATAVELCLFERPGDPYERDRLSLPERTGHIWHGYVPGLRPGQTYGFRVYGPYRPELGLRFNPAKLLLDPYARAIHGRLDYSGPVYAHEHGLERGDDEAPRCTRDDAPFVPRGVIVDPTFDWEGDAAPQTSWGQTIIYETHVKGLTRLFPHVRPEWRGTYLGLTDPNVIDHLQTIGVTAVELLPVHAWIDEPSVVSRGLTNYWGYNSVAYFAPDARYAVSGSLGQQVIEFKEMVKALHAAEIEVILDVVYNHTGEGDHLGPIVSLRGIDNPVYYRLDPSQPRTYVDVTGTGNSVNVQRPDTLRLVMDSLRYWVQEMHVDGFRFDLAPALAREVFEVDRDGSFFDAVHQDPILSRVKLIAEPWDVGADGYHVGGFPIRWSEWNGKYRDGVRHFWRGDDGWIADMGYRLTGSSDLYKDDGRQPYASINFVTAHDGFTLNDLVSYDQKHNSANGEDNTDGSNDNISANYGVEGPTESPEIRAVRYRQRRNFLATLFFSQGTPMLLGGDEIGRTQRGNNNAYCQDNDLSWYEWSLDNDDHELLAFVALLARIRHEQPVLRRSNFLLGSRLREIGAKDVNWLRPDGREMIAADWFDPGLHALGLVLHGDAIVELDEWGRPVTGETLAILMNAGLQSVQFDLSHHADHAPRGWQTLVDTAFPPDNDGRLYGSSALVSVLDRSLLLLREIDPGLAQPR
ncbi:MAG: glycogen debranching protein GlgX [Thermomicrobiales bacterium]